MLLNCYPGLLQKLMDNGYYAAFGQMSITVGAEIRKNEPIIQANMFMVYIGLAIGALLAQTEVPRLLLELRSHSGNVEEKMN